MANTNIGINIEYYFYCVVLTAFIAIFGTIIAMVENASCTNRWKTFEVETRFELLKGCRIVTPSGLISEEQYVLDLLKKTKKSK